MGSLPMAQLSYHREISPKKAWFSNNKMNFKCLDGVDAAP